MVNSDPGSTAADPPPAAGGLVLSFDAARLLHLPFAGLRAAVQVGGGLAPDEGGLRQGRVEVAWLGPDGQAARQDVLEVALPLAGEPPASLRLAFFDGSLPVGTGAVVATLIDGAGTTRATARAEAVALRPAELPLQDQAVTLPLRGMRLLDLPALPLGAPVPVALQEADKRLVMREPGEVRISALHEADLAQMRAAKGAIKRFMLGAYPLNGLWVGELRGATVMGQTGTVVGRGGIPDECWGADHPRVPPWYQLRPFMQAWPDPPEPCGDAAMWWAGPFRKHNYYHTHGESLAALAQIDMARDLGALPDFDILLPDMSGWVKEAVDLLGLDARRLLPIANRCLQPERLYWASAVLRHNVGIEPLLRQVCRRIRANALAREAAGVVTLPELPGRDDIVYVARTDSTIRPMLNEAALIEALRARGVRIFVSAGLTYAQQVLCLSRARVVIGPHGAGLTNIGFARPGALVVEIHPFFYTTPLYLRFAHVLGQRYRAYTAPETEGADVAARTWLLDLPAFLSFLDPLLEEEARSGRI